MVTITAYDCLVYIFDKQQNYEIVIVALPCHSHSDDVCALFLHGVNKKLPAHYQRNFIDDLSFLKTLDNHGRW